MENYEILCDCFDYGLKGLDFKMLFGGSIEIESLFWNGFWILVWGLMYIVF